MEKNKKIWSYTRYGFWTMIGLWVLSMVSTIFSESIIFGVIWIGVTIFTFINSIRHLTHYKEKGLAITALVISSFLILLFLIGILYGIILILAEI